MPNKYSHSVVVAGYSSRGLLGLPNDQRSDYLDSTPSVYKTNWQSLRSKKPLTEAQDDNPGSASGVFWQYASPEQLQADQDVSLGFGHARSSDDDLKSFATRSRRTFDIHAASARLAPLQPSARFGYRLPKAGIPQARREPSGRLPSHPFGISTRQADAGRSVKNRKQPGAEVVEGIRLANDDKNQSPIPEYEAQEIRKLPTRYTSVQALPSSASPPLPVAGGEPRRRSERPATLQSQLDLCRQGSDTTIQTRIYSPLPDDVDFDGFSDSTEEAFMQRLIIPGQGTTSEVRPSMIMTSQHVPSQAVDTSGSSPVLQPSPFTKIEAAGPLPQETAKRIGLVEQSSVGQFRSQQQAPRPLQQHDSLSSLSSFGSAELCRSQPPKTAQEVGVPSIVRATTPQKPMARSNNLIPPILVVRPPTPSERYSTTGRRHIQFSEESERSVVPTSTSRVDPKTSSLSGTRDRSARDADLVSRHPIQSQNSFQRPHLPSEALNEPSFDEEDTVSDTDAAIPPDITKYKVRGGVTSPLANLEQVLMEGLPDGFRSRSDRIRDAERTLNELKSQESRRRGGSKDGRGTEKAKEGLLKKLREKSLGGKK